MKVLMIAVFSSLVLGTSPILAQDDPYITDVQLTSDQPFYLPGESAQFSIRATTEADLWVGSDPFVFYIKKADGENFLATHSHQGDRDIEPAGYITMNRDSEPENWLWNQKILPFGASEESAALPGDYVLGAYFTRQDPSSTEEEETFDGGLSVFRKFQIVSAPAKSGLSAIKDGSLTAFLNPTDFPETIGTTNVSTFIWGEEITLYVINDSQDDMGVKRLASLEYAATEKSAYTKIRDIAFPKKRLAKNGGRVLVTIAKDAKSLSGPGYYRLVFTTTNASGGLQQQRQSTPPAVKRTLRFVISKKAVG